VRLLPGPDDRRAAIAGFVSLAVVAVVYPLIAEDTARPLAMYVLPPLITAALGGWRPTALVGTIGMALAVATSIAGPLDAPSMIARWAVVLAGTLMGAIGAAVREAQSQRLAVLDETVALRGAFERALAPAPISPPGFLAVSRYRPAESRMHLGGDFVEGVALPGGRLAVLIGDVCGHGPREAAFGAALRAGWKSIALAGSDDPVDWVTSLERAFFRDGRIDQYATVCTGWFDRDHGTLRLITLGHPPPLLLDGTPTELVLKPSPPLGLGFAGPIVTTDHPWNGEPLLFYSDGLVENPRRGDRTDRWGVEGLVRWLEGRRDLHDLVRIADDLVVTATTDRDRDDDVAVLLVADEARLRVPAPPERAA
jgi:serine phosphatase RsbU (regulator of sigma subunit)